MTTTISPWRLLFNNRQSLYKRNRPNVSPTIIPSVIRQLRKNTIAPIVDALGRYDRMLRIPYSPTDSIPMIHAGRKYVEWHIDSPITFEGLQKCTTGSNIPILFLLIAFLQIDGEGYLETLPLDNCYTDSVNCHPVKSGSICFLHPFIHHRFYTRKCRDDVYIFASKEITYADYFVADITYIGILQMQELTWYGGLHA